MNKKVIHTVLEYQVVENGPDTAVECCDRRVTYSDLNNRANRFANLLAHLGLAKGDITAVFFDKPLIQLYALIGIFKAGGVYMPLDEKFRQNHWREVYEHIRPGILLVTSGYYQLQKGYFLSFSCKIPTIVVVEEEDAQEHFKVLLYKDGNYTEQKIDVPLICGNPEVSVDGDDPNYIFFTSGSTGRPKAVLGNHKSLSHFVHWESREFAITGEDRVGQLTSLAFDASLRDIFTPLICGGTICMPPREIKEDIRKLQRWIADTGITLIHTIPTLMRLLFSEGAPADRGSAFTPAFPKLRYLLLAGEKLYKKDVVNWRSAFGSNTTIVNLYGATEATLVKTFSVIGPDIPGDLSAALHVGQPIANTIVLILNEQQEICEIDEVGEVFIKTPFLSMGYYKDQPLTAEKFVCNPLSPEEEIIYRTGDYGMYDTERNIVILGRQDGVVKNNGVRIDLNYIESVINRVTVVKHAVCFLEANLHGEKVLTCCYSATGEVQGILREHCMDLLSSYEVPSVFLRLDHFPVNANGKTDMAALKQYIRNAESAGAPGQEPVTDTEKDLVTVWKDILGRTEIGLSDHFLHLGGDSIRLIRLRSAIHKFFNRELSIEELFRTPVLKEQALLIDRAAPAVYSSIPKVFRSDGYELSPVQERLWVLSQFPEVSLAYNMPGEISLAGSISIEYLRRALGAIISRHESLRTVFRYNNNGELRQWVLTSEELDFSIEEIDFRMLPDAEAAARAYIANDEKKCFDLEHGPLLRAALIRITQDYSCLYYNMHHIISDGISNEILKKEVVAHYNTLQEGTPVQGKELTVQYKDYAVWQRANLVSSEFLLHRHYWLQKLKSVQSPLQLSIQKRRPDSNTYKGHRIGACILPEDFSLLKAFCSEQGGTLFMGMLSLWAVLFYKYSHQRAVVIGTPVAGRSHNDLRDVIGCFINSLPLKVDIAATDSLADIFLRMKREVLDSYAHGDYPFDRMIDDLDLSVSHNRNPLFDIMLSYHNIFGDKSSLAPVNTECEDLGPVVAKLDMLVNFIEEQHHIYLTLDFNTDLFSYERVAGLLADFRVMMRTLLAHPEQQIGEATSRAEVTRKLRQSNIQKLKTLK